MNKIFQCCYTNDIRDINGKISSGWGTVAVSPELPQDALEVCEKLQNANSTIPSEMTDEFGNVLNLEEISGDGNYIYVIRTKYGMRDRLGRANMFSHAFIFPCRGTGIVENPNTFLNIADADFKNNKEEAERFCDVLDFSITGGEEYNIRDALSLCRIGKNEYRILIKCIYAQIAEKKIAEPLYIEYDGKESTRRPLLYCIYFGLPFSVRRCLSVASCPTANTGNKNIIFTIDARNKGNYIVVNTGENNVLSSRLEKRLSRYGFVDFVADNYMKEGCEKYFNALEAKAIDLGDESAYDKLVLKIAHLLITEQGISSLKDISDDELVLRLSDALRTQSIGNSAMNEYITRLLDEIRQRNLTLTDEMEIQLANRTGNSAEVLLPNVIEKDKETAAVISKRQDVCFNETVEESWKKIQNDMLWYNREVVKRSWKLYNKELSNIRNPNFDIIELYSNYRNILKRILGMDLSRYEQAAKEAYWKKMDFHTVSFLNFKQYKILNIRNDKANIIIKYSELPQILKEKGESIFFRYVNDVFTNMDKFADVGASDKIYAKEHLLTYIKTEGGKLSEFFDVWYSIFCSIPRTVQYCFFEMYDVVQDGEEKKINECYSRVCDICKLYHVDGDIQRQLETLVKKK